MLPFASRLLSLRSGLTRPKRRISRLTTLLPMRIRHATERLDDRVALSPYFFRVRHANTRCTSPLMNGSKWNRIDRSVATLAQSVGTSLTTTLWASVAT
ncbi:MAG: hypothetical protein HZA46_05880 [Planctomycetales bacterium]|nr:hypothetical protein [Planctomycetales bacterium]